MHTLTLNQWLPRDHIAVVWKEVTTKYRFKLKGGMVNKITYTDHVPDVIPHTLKKLKKIGESGH